MKKRLWDWARILGPALGYLALRMGLGLLPGAWGAVPELVLQGLLCVLLSLRLLRQEGRTVPGLRPEPGLLLLLPAALLLAAAAGLLPRAPLPGPPLPALLASCLLGPLCEELLYRGLLLPRSRALLGLWPGLLLSALLFSLGHGAWEQMLLSFPAGLLLGLLFLRFRSLWAPAAVHIAVNLLALLPSPPRPLAWAGLGGLGIFLGLLARSVRKRTPL